MILIYDYITMENKLYVITHDDGWNFKSFYYKKLDNALNQFKLFLDNKSLTVCNNSFLEGKFAGAHHVARVEKIMAIENGTYKG